MVANGKRRKGVLRPRDSGKAVFSAKAASTSAMNAVAAAENLPLFSAAVSRRSVAYCLTHSLPLVLTARW